MEDKRLKDAITRMSWAIEQYGKDDLISFYLHNGKEGRNFGVLGVKEYGEYDKERATEILSILCEAASGMTAYALMQFELNNFSHEFLQDLKMKILDKSEEIKIELLQQVPQDVRDRIFSRSNDDKQS